VSTEQGRNIAKRYRVTIHDERLGCGRGERENMEEKIMRKILRQAPCGYAYYKILFNERGEAED